MPKFLFLLLTILILFAFNCQAMFEQVTPDEVGLDPDLLNKLDQEIKEIHSYLYNFLVLKDGKLVFEKYYNGHTHDTAVLVASVTKSFLSTLVGIVYDRGNINLETRLIEYYPQYLDYITDDRIYDIKVKHLLNMTSGIKYNVATEITRWIAADDQIKYAFKAPVITPPGESFRYNDPAVHLLTYILEKETGADFRAYAEENLFKPLGINEYHWEEDKLGTPFGSHGLWLKPRDMIKLGQLYLNGGTWNGARIISEEWIGIATTEKAAGGFPYRGRYGYLWWLDEFDGYDYYFAAGFGGQFIIVIPEVKLVVAINSDIKTHRDVYIRNLVNKYILPSFKE